MEISRYLDRIGIDQGDLRDASLSSLRTLQSEHVKSVPFETLSITGGPNHTFQGEQVNLNIDDIYIKIVEGNRGGWCFELNVLFGWLLDKLGFNVRHLPARVLTSKTIPANHLTLLVTVEEDYLVDVGLGIPTMRQPIPFGGNTDNDEAGVQWRMLESNRPDANYVTQFRTASSSQWTDRYIIDGKSRELTYFEATAEFLSIAPESPFTGSPVVTRATEKGHAKLTTEVYSSIENSHTEMIEISSADWEKLLREEFNITT